MKRIREFCRILQSQEFHHTGEGRYQVISSAFWGQGYARRDGKGYCAKVPIPIFVLAIIWLIYVSGPSFLHAQEGKVAAPTVKPEQLVKGEIATDSDQYVIGPEDVLHIHVWGEEALTINAVPVRMDGKISLPLVDDVQAAGLTPLQLKVALTEKLKGFVDNPTVSVTVLEANSFKVYVTGEVKQPGVMRIRSPVTLVKLITMAGGFTEWANRKKILIITRENGKEKRITANYNKIIDGKEPDIVIKQGDIIVVK